MEKLSFVIPCYRSEKTIKRVIDEIIVTVMERAESYDYEIIAVNDASPDNVYEVLKKAAAENDKIKVIDFAKNMGKYAAVLAGYSVVTGEYVVNIDDDYQCPVNELWKMLQPLYEGYDVVMAKYPVKQQSDFKNFGSRMNAIMTNILLDKPKDLSMENFFITKRFVADEMIKYKNPYPYLEGLILRTIRKITNVIVEERTRADDNSSGFTFWKSFSLWINGFTSFSVKPLRIATLAGSLLSLFGFIYGIIVIIHKFMDPTTPMGYSSIMAAILFVGGMVLLVLGLIGEYIGRMYICMNESPQYVIRETINCDRMADVKTELGE